MKLGNKVPKEAAFLKQLNCAKGFEQTHLLKTCSSDQILCLIEIMLNLLKFRIKLTKRQREKLLVHASLLRKLAYKRSEAGARKLLVQKGSGFGFLAAVLTPVLIELAKSAIEKI